MRFSITDFNVRLIRTLREIFEVSKSEKVIAEVSLVISSVKPVNRVNCQMT